MPKDKIYCSKCGKQMKYTTDQGGKFSPYEQIYTCSKCLIGKTVVYGAPEGVRELLQQ